MMKNRSRFIHYFFLASVIFPSQCIAEFDNSIGFGVQYSGIFGWQGSWTEENVHARIALGLIGLTAGVDVNMDQHTSIGFTSGVIGLAQFNALNLNYYPGGQYTQGWRVGLDVGRWNTHFFDEKNESFASISFGYSFK